MIKTKPQNVDPKQVKLFLADAQKKAAAARNNLTIDEEAAYQIAYQAMLKGSLALMLRHGQPRPLQLGKRSARSGVAQKHLERKLAGTFALVDRMRRKRNEAVYDVAIISGDE